MPPADVVTPQLLRGWALPEADDDGDKHARGTVVVVGGSVTTPGALLLTGLAALRAGAGKLQILTVEATAVALAVSVPEAAVAGLATASDGSLSPEAADEVVSRSERATAVILGPGLLDDEGAGALLRRVLPRLDDVPVVLDGLALRGLSGHPQLLEGIPAVLTPNGSEVRALLGGEELEGQEAAQAVARRYGAAVSAPGWIAAPDGRTWCVEAGGIGLGTSGSGDVQAGLVGACSPAGRHRSRRRCGASTCTRPPGTC